MVQERGQPGRGTELQQRRAAEAAAEISALASAGGTVADQPAGPALEATGSPSAAMTRLGAGVLDRLLTADRRRGPRTESVAAAEFFSYRRPSTPCFSQVTLRRAWCRCGGPRGSARDAELRRGADLDVAVCGDDQPRSSSGPISPRLTTC